MINDDRCGGDVVVAAVVKVGTTVKLGCDDKSGVAMRRMGYYYNKLAIAGPAARSGKPLRRTLLRYTGGLAIIRNNAWKTWRWETPTFRSDRTLKPLGWVRDITYGCNDRASADPVDPSANTGAIHRLTALRFVVEGILLDLPNPVALSIIHKRGGS
jgi:hypothetical protein